MPSITSFDTTPPESFKDQIKDLVIANYLDAAPVAIAPGNPLQPLYQYVLGYEVHLMLEAISGDPHKRFALLAVLDDEDPSILLGFLLYQVLAEVDDACNLSYLVVREGHRRQGLARALLQHLQARYPHVDLACQPAQADVFEGLGLRAVGVDGPRLLMSTRSQVSDGLRPLMDLQPIFSSKEVRQIHAYLLKQHGEQAMRDAEQQRDEQLDEQAGLASAVLRSRTRH